jgi:hypothetical protein
MTSYQQSKAKRCAHRRFPRSPASVGAKLCVQPAHWYAFIYRGLTHAAGDGPEIQVKVYGLFSDLKVTDQPT